MNRRLSSLLAGLALLLTAAVAGAQQVTASLDRPSTSIGQPVQLDIEVNGSMSAEPPASLQVDNLQFEYLGARSQTTLLNFKLKSSVIFSYAIIPLKAGQYKIPPIPVRVAGRTYKTAPIALEVGSDPGNIPVMPAQPVNPRSSTSMFPPGPPPVPAAPSHGPVPNHVPDDRVASGALLIPGRSSVYVGEVVLAKIVFNISAEYQVQLQDRPDFSGDGFSVLNISKPTQREVEIDGYSYNEVTFYAAISPVKTGPLQIPPAKIDARIQVPGQMPPGFDAFSMFSGMTSDVREVTISTKPFDLTVKALPTDGRPENFSGAIGQFALSSSVNPKKTENGDPLTLSVKVDGSGNFAAMGAPELTEADAWRSYPPSEEFTPSKSDPVGFNGSKTFKFMILPKTDTNQTPSPIFSFFDPKVEKYVTLRSNPMPVVAKAGALPAATPAAVAAAATPPPAAAAPTPGAPQTKADELAYNLNAGSFTPLFLQKNFLIANAAAAAVWLALILIGVGRAVAGSTMAQKSGRRREIRRQLHELDREGQTVEAFLAGAEAFIRSRLAGRDSFADLRDLAASLTPATRDGVLSILNRADEVRYSALAATREVSAEERHQTIQQLETLDEELPR